MTTEFEWDEAKAYRNFVKHGVEFAYAARVFMDPANIVFDASREHDGEVRRKAVGVIDGKLYVLLFTDRSGACRIISARRTNRTEDRAYGEI